MKSFLASVHGPDSAAVLLLVTFKAEHLHQLTVCRDLLGDATALGLPRGLVQSLALDPYAGADVRLIDDFTGLDGYGAELTALVNKLTLATHVVEVPENLLAALHQVGLHDNGDYDEDDEDDEDVDYNEDRDAEEGGIEPTISTLVVDGYGLNFEGDTDEDNEWHSSTICYDAIFGE
jgi:hypothetical protein